MSLATFIEDQSDQPFRKEEFSFVNPLKIEVKTLDERPYPTQNLNCFRVESSGLIFAVLITRGYALKAGNKFKGLKLIGS